MFLKTKFFSTFFILIFLQSFSQQKLDYIGVLKLNDTSFISYRLHLDEVNGKLAGYSVTDIGGKHETKSKVIGAFSSKNSELTFKESGIVYTKSKIKQYDFCFVNYKGKLKKINSKTTISGAFRGLYSDGKECISGTISLQSLEKIVKKAVKLDKKIKSIKNIKNIPQEKKDKIDVVKSIDTLSMNILKSDQNLYMFTKDKEITFEIRDSGVEDGDKINVYVNKKLILENYTVTAKDKIIKVPIVDNIIEIEVEAVNEGEVAPNTADVVIKDSENELKTISKLKQGKRTKISILRKE